MEMLLQYPPIGEVTVTVPGELTTTYKTVSVEPAEYITVIFNPPPPKRKYMPLKERVKQAELLAAKNDGQLPRFCRLMRIEPAFAQAVLRNPTAFAHIVRESNVNLHLADHVKAAEEIAVEKGGLLPSYTDLLKEHRRLAGVVRDKPAAFAHIPRAKTVNRQRRMAERVAEAEALAEANGGVLECTAEFQKNHNALIMHMRRHPTFFEHIPRKRRLTNTLQQHVVNAEVIAAENGGRLPASSILRKDHSALDEAIRKNRTAFAHIPRDGKTRTSRNEIKLYVAIAEKLAAENFGVLPHAGKLRLINNNLLSTIYRHPELFAHIPQEIRDGRRSLVSIRNGEVLPSSNVTGSLTFPIATAEEPVEEYRPEWRKFGE